MAGNSMSVPCMGCVLHESSRGALGTVAVHVSFSVSPKQIRLQNEEWFQLSQKSTSLPGCDG